jgi:hypothetical protein
MNRVSTAALQMGGIDGNGASIPPLLGVAGRYAEQGAFQPVVRRHCEVRSNRQTVQGLLRVSRFGDCFTAFAMTVHGALSCNDGPLYTVIARYEAIANTHRDCFGNRGNEE